MPTGSISNLGERPCLILNGRYSVDIDGNVFDRCNDVYCEYVDGKVILFSGSQELKFTKAFIIAITTRDVFVDVSLLHLLDILFEDGDSNNLDPNNLIIKYPDEGLEHPYMDNWYYIPGYSRYIINRTGRVLNMCHNSEKSFSLGTHGYLETSMVKDSRGGRAVGIHRLLALTFIPYGRHVKSNHVNHIDHDKLNTSIQNLEWVTPSQNIKAAIEFGARQTQRKGVHIKNLRTGIIQTFPSIEKCAEYLKTGSPNVHRALEVSKANRTILLQKYIAIRDGEKWPDITVDDIGVRARANGSPVLAKNLKTGEISRHSTAMAFVRYCGLSKKAITSRLAKNDQGPVGDYIFKYEDIEDDWKI